MSVQTALRADINSNSDSRNNVCFFIINIYLPLYILTYIINAIIIPTIGIIAIFEQIKEHPINGCSFFDFYVMYD